MKKFLAFFALVSFISLTSLAHDPSKEDGDSKKEAKTSCSSSSKKASCCSKDAKAAKSCTPEEKAKCAKDDAKAHASCSHDHSKAEAAPAKATEAAETK